VRGKTAYDQNVADNFVESGVGRLQLETAGAAAAGARRAGRQVKAVPSTSA
jgi:hypothetical protein